MFAKLFLRFDEYPKLWFIDYEANVCPVKNRRHHQAVLLLVLVLPVIVFPPLTLLQSYKFTLSVSVPIVFPLDEMKYWLTQWLSLSHDAHIYPFVDAPTNPVWTSNN